MESKPADAPSHQEGASKPEEVKAEETKNTDVQETKVNPETLNSAQGLASAIGANMQDMQSLAKKHEFWGTQPVPREGDTGEEGEIDKDHKVEDVRKSPLPLLEQFEWAELDMKVPTDVEEIYTFLTENYVEDEDGLFRFDYSKDFLQWALTPPGYYQDWIFGVRVRKK